MSYEVSFGATRGEGDGPVPTVNATAVSSVNFSDTNPAAPSSGINVDWQFSGNDVSANIPVVMPQFSFASVALAGTATACVRADATINAFSTAVPVVVDPDFSGSAGVSGKAARSDHRHGITITNNPPENLGSAAFVGVQSLSAREDHIHKSQSPGDFYAETTGKGLVTKDTQATPRYWRMFAKEGATTPASGGVTITINSAGAISATRDGGAAGDVIIRIDDTGTSAP